MQPRKNFVRDITLGTIAGLAVLAAGCGTNGSTGTVSSALASATLNVTVSSGLLACAPSTDQTDACTGKAAGDACSLTAPDGATVDGTCRTTLDGGAVGCAPNPPAPPAAAVAACAGKAADDSCTIDDRDADTDSGLCALARDGVTLACARAFTPPQPAIDACAGKAKDDACTLTGRKGESLGGTCGYGPQGASKVLACGPRGRFPDAAAACAGVVAGGACTLAAGHESATGVCTAAANGAVLCVVACNSLGHPMNCHGHGGEHGPGGRGGRH